MQPIEPFPKVVDTLIPPEVAVTVQPEVFDVRTSEVSRRQIPPAPLEKSSKQPPDHLERYSNTIAKGLLGK